MIVRALRGSFNLAPNMLKRASFSDKFFHSVAPVPIYVSESLILSVGITYLSLSSVDWNRCTVLHRNLLCSVFRIRQTIKRANRPSVFIVYDYRADSCESQPHKGHLTSILNYRWFPSYLPCTLILFPFHLLPFAAHPTWFFFSFFPCFPAIFILLPSQQQ